MRTLPMATCETSTLAMQSLLGLTFGNLQLAGSDFGNVRQFAGSDWTGTFWWQASAISSPLFRYLLQKFRYAGPLTGPRSRDYADSIQRLKR